MQEYHVTVVETYKTDHPKIAWDKLILKSVSLFTRNSSVTGRSVFLIVKPGKRAHK